MDVRKFLPFFCATCLAVLVFSAPACAQMDIDNPDLFKQYNPDGHKYHFVKGYLESLKYLVSNVEMNQEINREITEEEKIERLQVLRNNLVQNNVNLRVARNYFDRYTKDEANGLMLLAVEQFRQYCDQIIDLNTDERVQLEYYYEALSSNDEENFDFKNFNQERRTIQKQRKEASKGLLQTSQLVGKILVSNKANYFGEFDTLGITQEERYKLLFVLDEFKGEAFEGDVRVGQTFLEASVTSLRKILEDYRFSTLDG